MDDHGSFQSSGEIAVQGRFLKWLDNFWYHYKWTVIISAFFLVVFLVCFVQCLQTVETDIPVVFVGGYVQEEGTDAYTWTSSERTAIEGILKNLFEKNSGQEGKQIGFLTYSVYTEEELRAKATDEDGNFSQYAFSSMKQTNLNELDTFSDYRMTGECSVWFVSPYVYTEKKVSETAMPLSELFEDVPSSAYDDYAIRLGDTAFYRYYDVFQRMPADTLIVLSRGWVYGASSNAQTYENYQTLYRAIVTFEAP